MKKLITFFIFILIINFGVGCGSEDDYNNYEENSACQANPMYCHTQQACEDTYEYYWWDEDCHIVQYETFQPYEWMLGKWQYKKGFDICENGVTTVRQKFFDRWDQRMERWEISDSPCFMTYFSYLSKNDLGEIIVSNCDDYVQGYCSEEEQKCNWTYCDKNNDCMEFLLTKIE